MYLSIGPGYRVRTVHPLVIATLNAFMLIVYALLDTDGYSPFFLNTKYLM